MEQEAGSLLVAESPPRHKPGGCGKAHSLLCWHEGALDEIGGAGTACLDSRTHHVPSGTHRTSVNHPNQAVALALLTWIR